MTDIERKIERSSFGTRNAQAARRTVSQDAAAKVVSRAAEIAAKNSSKIFGGNPASHTYTSSARPIQPGKARRKESE